jgi:hypothetical protein
LFRYLLRIRYLSAVAAVIFAVHAIGFMALGVLRAVEAYRLLGRGANFEGVRPGVHMAESVDALLFGLVMLVLANGTASLFLTSHGGDRNGNVDEERELPAWMRVRNLSGLKMLLWEAILAALVVAAGTGIASDMPNITWHNLLLPAAILLLTVSHVLLKRSDSK